MTEVPDAQRVQDFYRISRFLIVDKSSLHPSTQNLEHLGLQQLRGDNHPIVIVCNLLYPMALR